MRVEYISGVGKPISNAVVYYMQFCPLQRRTVFLEIYALVHHSSIAVLCHTTRQRMSLEYGALRPGSAEVAIIGASLSEPHLVTTAAALSVY